MRETPLREEHEKLGARMVDFAGWLMPVVYTNIMEEHKRVRTKVGLFDVSHMGRYWIGGRDHIKLTDRIITNSRATMKPGQIRYSLVLNGQGGILDDVLVYSMGDEGTMLVVNAGNRDVIWSWITRERKGFVVDIKDMSEDYAMIAMQGPESANLMAKISDLDTKKLKYYRFTRSTVLGEAEVMVSRTGYTGEDGFEVIMPAAKAAHFWSEMLNVGKPLQAGPAGLGARDTLRLEAGMPLHGHEISDTINPLEAGLDWAVKLEKEDFIGKQATVDLKEKGLTQKLVGLNIAGKRIPRQDQDVIRDGKVVGKICSGTKAPWLDEIIATAYVPANATGIGTTYHVDFPSKGTRSVKPGETQQTALVVPLPFYKRPGKK
ncbi:MAG: glycine cleavage system aminomethyltransferase GcvT [Planctomycetes bacterium]|nr:glycine cleavage system aminomethyltransferase GcvT [Planctomycetota bacterium]